jgi:RimJ/RimL family protein N-acetyltransferase
VEPILRDFPQRFETERLTIRALRPGDEVDVRKAVLESQAELRPWMPWAVEIMSQEEYAVYVRKAYLAFLAREDLAMGLFLTDSGSLVGASGLHNIDWEVPKFEIGYWVRARFARQGYITEAVAGLTEFAFEMLGARRIEIHCDAKNERSAAVPKRLGFIQEGVLHNVARHHVTNELVDRLIFAKVKRERD